MPKSVRQQQQQWQQQPERRFFSKSESIQTGDYASAFYSRPDWSDTLLVITTCHQGPRV